MVAAAVEQSNPERLTAAAHAKFREAKIYKREMYKNRIALRKAMDEFHEIERLCQERGIRLVFEH